MDMQNRECAVFIFCGLLESGKTNMIRRLLGNPRFCDGERKVAVILCEEGIEEYDDALLAKSNATVFPLEEEERYDEAVFRGIEIALRPDIVIVEYNGMWSGTLPLEMRYPAGWQIAEIMTTVDSTTFATYSKNLRSIMVEQYKAADIVVCNRFDDATMDKITFRSLIKSANMSAQVVYEYPDGTLDAAFDGSPFDLTQDEVVIDDNDFGVFYFDIMDHAEKYEGKIVTLRAMAVKLAGTKTPGFLVGRFAMTCCEDDIQFISVYAKNDKNFKNRAWYTVRARAMCVDASVYGESGGHLLPAFEVLEMTPAEAPVQQLVTF